MFCFQCEQTAGCKACEGNVGVCGKKADTAELQDKLTGSLIGLARATEGNDHMVSDSTAAVIVEGLFATVTNVNFDNDALKQRGLPIGKPLKRIYAYISRLKSVCKFPLPTQSAWI